MQKLPDEISAEDIFDLLLEKTHTKATRLEILKFFPVEKILVCVCSFMLDTTDKQRIYSMLVSVKDVKILVLNTLYNKIKSGILRDQINLELKKFLVEKKADKINKKIMSQFLRVTGRLIVLGESKGENLH